MGIFDALKKIGSVSKGLIEKTAREVKYRQKVKEIKIEILMRFKFDQLKRISASKGIGDTKIVGDAISGYKRVKIRNKEELARKIADSLSLSEIKQLAKRYRIQYKDLEDELEEYKKQLYSTKVSQKELEMEEKAFKEVEEEEGYNLSVLLEDFEPQPVTSEEDFEKQLYQYLVAKLGRGKVKRQVSIESGQIDLVIDNRIGIEVKLAKRREDLRTLLGQIIDYKDYFDKIVALILDLGHNIDLESYKSKLKNLGAEVLIFKGMYKRIGRKKQIIIKL